MHSDDLHARRSFDKFNFVSIWSIDENKPAAGGGLCGSVCNFDSLRVERGNGVVEALYLKGKMDEIFLNSHWSARRETGQLDQFLAVRHFEEREMRPTRRDLSFQHLQSKHIRVELDGLFHVADPHAGVEEFGDFHGADYKQSALSNQLSASGG